MICLIIPEEPTREKDNISILLSLSLLLYNGSILKSHYLSCADLLTGLDIIIGFVKDLLSIRRQFQFK